MSGKYYGRVNDVNGYRIRNAKITVYETGTTTKATLVDDAGDPLANPVTSDSGGEFSFIVPDGVYDLAIIKNGATTNLDKLVIRGGKDSPLDSGMSLVGDASISNNCLFVTTDTTNQHSAAWWNRLVKVDEDWQTIFSFSVATTGPDTADGIAFVIQSQSTSELGLAGAGIGYEGITDVFAIEFDNYRNIVAPNYGDPASDHIAVMDGGPNHSVNQLARYDLGTFTNHDVIITYTGSTRRLVVNVDAVDRIDITLGSALSTIVGNANAYFGFTGSTGALTSEQQICNWTFEGIKAS